MGKGEPPMKPSLQWSRAADARIPARLGRRIAGFAAWAILVSFAVVQAGEARAQGRGEDERLNLFLDTEGLIGPGAETEEAESGQNLTEGEAVPRKPGEAPTGGTRWEWDPIFLQSREVGDPRKSEVDFRDSQFAIEFRRLF